MSYDTPKEAACGDIPSPYARILAVSHSPSGDHAVVLLGTNEPPQLYPYQVVCSRSEGGWVPGIGGNGPGTSYPEDGVSVTTVWRDLGDRYDFAAIWDEAP